MGPMVIVVIVIVALVTASMGAALGQMLEARRRVAAMEVIKAAMAAGREPPREVLDELTRAGQRRPPWTEVIAFTALAVGFWVAFNRVGDESSQTAFMVVASTMTVTAAGLLVLALASGRGSTKTRDGE